MFAEERIRKIKEILLEYEHVDINTLTSLLNASVTTVRRDLDRLENEGFLLKAHGGAVLKHSSELSAPMQTVETPYEAEQQQIARLAAKYVEDNDVLFLGSGHVSYLIARELKNKKNLQVVTNNLKVAYELSSQPLIKVFATGGDVETTQDSVIFTGRLVAEQVSQFFFRKAFLSFSGISMEFGYTHNIRSEIPVFQTLLSHTAIPIAVADYSRFDTTGFQPVCGLDEIHTVMTNVTVPERYKDYYLSHGIRIFTSFEDLMF